jgi:hypothetical protein
MKTNRPRFFISTLTALFLLLSAFLPLTHATTGGLLGYPKFRAFTASGVPLAGGKLYTYAPGTTTPKSVYVDRACTTPAANPVVLDANGEATIYLNGAYKLDLQNSASVEQSGWPVDNVQGNGLSGASTTFTANATAPSVATGTSVFITNNSVDTTVGSFTGLTSGASFDVLVADTHTTFNFGAAHLHGNAGVQYKAAIYDVVHCASDGTDADCILSSGTAQAPVVITGATPSIAGYKFVKTNNATTTTMTNVTGHVAGQVTTFIFGDSNTTVSFSGGNFKGHQSTDWQPLANDSMTCTSDGTYEYCSNAPGVANTLTYRNRLINGEMRIDQRNAGAAQTITQGAGNIYTVDRWFAAAVTSNVTGQQVAAAAPFTKAYQITGAASNTYVSLGQKIESVNIVDQVGQTVTFSAYVSSSSLTSITWYSQYANSLDNWTGATAISAGTWGGVTGTPQRFIGSFTVPANGANGISVIIQAASGLGAGQTLTVTGCQLEPGSGVSAFERRPDDAERQRCWRYLPCFRNTVSSQQSLQASGQCLTTTTAMIVLPFPVMARETATGVASVFGISVSAVGDLSVTKVDGTTQAVTAFTGGAQCGIVTPASATIPVTVAANLVAGNATRLIMAGPSTYLYINGFEL